MYKHLITEYHIDLCARKNWSITASWQTLSWNNLSGSPLGLSAEFKIRCGKFVDKRPTTLQSIRPFWKLDGQSSVIVVLWYKGWARVV